MRARRVSYRQEWVRCGKAHCRCRAGDKHGPYWYANWTDETGRRRKRYLGKKLRRISAAELAAPPRPVRLPRARAAPNRRPSSYLGPTRATTQPKGSPSVRKPVPTAHAATKPTRAHGPSPRRPKTPPRAKPIASRSKPAAVVEPPARKLAAQATPEPETMGAPPASSAPRGSISRQALLDAVRKNVDPRMGLAFVPSIVRSLGHGIPEAHRALLDAYRQGAIELRPESGLSRLSPEELAACVPGPWDSRLSWVRLL